MLLEFMIIRGNFTWDGELYDVTTVAGAKVMRRRRSWKKKKKIVLHARVELCVRRTVFLGLCAERNELTIHRRLPTSIDRNAIYTDDGGDCAIRFWGCGS